MVSIKVQDILDKSIAGSSETRLLETGHQTALFAASDNMENKIKGQGKYCQHPVVLECPYLRESVVMGVLWHGGADVWDPQLCGPSHAGVLGTIDTMA